MARLLHKELLSEKILPEMEMSNNLPINLTLTRVCDKNKDTNHATLMPSGQHLCMFKNDSMMSTLASVSKLQLMHVSH